MFVWMERSILDPYVLYMFRSVKKILLPGFSSQQASDALRVDFSARGH